MKQFFSLAITLCTLPLHAADPNTFESQCALTARNLQSVAEHRIEQCGRASDNTPLHETILADDVPGVVRALAKNREHLTAQNSANINPAFLAFLKAIVSETPEEAKTALAMMHALLPCSTYSRIQCTPGVIVELPEHAQVDDAVHIKFGIDVDPWHAKRAELAQQEAWLDNNWSVLPPGD